MKTIHKLLILFSFLFIFSEMARSQTANAGFDASICTDSYTLQANNPAPYSGTWSFIGGSGLFENPTLFNTAVSDLGFGVNTLRWTVTDGTNTVYDEVVITNNSFSVNAGVNLTICNDVTTLSGSVSPAVNPSCQWTVVGGTGTFANPNNMVTEVSAITNGTNTYRLTAVANGCMSYDDISVTNDLPSAAYAGEDQIISVSNAVLGANTPTIGSGMWALIAGSANFSDITAFNSEVFGLGTGANIFRWTISNNGCSDFDDVTIFVNPVLSAVAMEDVSICTNEVTLTANNPAPFAGLWVVQNGSVTFANPSEYTTSATNIGQGTNVFLWTVTDGTNTVYDEVVVVNNSFNLNAGTDINICVQQATVTGTVFPNVAGSALWTIVGGTGTIVNPTNLVTQVNNIGVGANTYQLNYVANGCFRSDNITITNNSFFNISAGNDQTINSPNTILNATLPQNCTGFWSVVAGSAVVANLTLPNTEVMNIGLGENIFSWTVTNNLCTAADNVTITYTLNPLSANAGGDQIVCTNGANLYANNPEPYSGVWTLISGGANTTIENPTNYYTNVNDLGIGVNTFRWSVTDGTTTVFDDCNVTNNTPLSSTTGNVEICEDNTTLIASITSGASVLWSVVSGSGTIVSPTSTTTYITNIGLGENIFRCTVTSPVCDASNDIHVVNNSPTEAYAGEDQIIGTSNTTLNANTPQIGNGNWVVLAGSGSFTAINSPQSQVLDISMGANIYRWTITNFNCQSFDDVTIERLAAYTVAGNVQTEEKTDVSGVVVAFRSFNNSYKAMAYTEFDASGFEFETLLSGDYVIYAIPDISIFSELHPTYFGNKTFWNEAFAVTVDEDVFDLDITLKNTDVTAAGTGTISGRISYENPNVYESEVFDNDWFATGSPAAQANRAKNMTVYLFNSENLLVEWQLTNEYGQFSFTQLKNDLYRVYAEKSGYLMEEVLVEITDNNQNFSDITLVIDVEEIFLGKQLISENEWFEVFPNPTNNNLFIKLKNNVNENVTIQILNTNGQIVMTENSENLETTNFSIEHLQTGVYFVKIISEKGTSIQKIVKF